MDDGAGDDDARDIESRSSCSELCRLRRAYFVPSCAIA